MAVWGSGYKDSRVIGVAVGGGRASVAITVGSSPPAVKFKRRRGATWPDDSDAVAVGNLGSSTAKKVDILQVPGRTTLIATNGKDVHFVSEDDGAHWAALTTV